MNHLIFFDTETTGKGPDARLLQLCMKEQGRPAINLMFKPPVPIEFGAMATHHITEKMVEHCPPLDDKTREKIKLGFMGNIAVAHNASFDIQILKTEGIEIEKFICTYKVAQRLLDEPQYKLQYLRYKYCQDMEARAHDAEGDVLVLEKVFDFLLQKLRDYNGLLGKTPEQLLQQMITISSEPVLLKRIAFGKHAGKLFSEIPRDYLDWLKESRAKKPPEQPDPDLDFTLNHYANA